MSLFLDNLEAEIYRTAKYGGVITVRTQDKKVDITSTCLIDEMNLIMLGGRDFRSVGSDDGIRRPLCREEGKRASGLGACQKLY